MSDAELEALSNQDLMELLVSLDAMEKELKKMEGEFKDGKD